MSHESCKENGGLFEVAGGFIAKLRWQRTNGALFDLPFTPEEVSSRWNEVTTFDDKAENPTGPHDAINRVNENIERIKEKLEKAKTQGISAVAKPGDGLFSE